MQSPHTILIADDEKYIRKLATRILSIEGYKTILAENGGQAINLFNQNRDKIDLAILDIRMPDMTGIDVYRKINSEKPGLRVIFCSGYGNDDVPSECGDFFIQKPFSLNTFMETVRRVLNKSDEEVLRNNAMIIQFKENEDCNANKNRMPRIFG